MIICKAHKLIYLAPPKTGSASVVQWLQAPPFLGYPQDQLDSYHNTVWNERFRDWYIFLTTRHPYTRAVSYWQYVCRQIRWRQTCSPNLSGYLSWEQTYSGQLPSFLEFWDKHPDKVRQTTIWRASWHLEQIPRTLNKIVYQERLLADLSQILGGQGCVLERKHEAPVGAPWYDYYTPELISRVHEYWGQDFAAFGYNPDFEACVRGEFFTQTSPG